MASCVMRMATETGAGGVEVLKRWMSFEEVRGGIPEQQY
jgi:hypothetical protein